MDERMNDGIWSRSPLHSGGGQLLMVLLLFDYYFCKVGAKLVLVMCRED